MKSVLISIRPQWCDLIASGKKTIEVRKTRPKLETPFKCYIYETKAICDTPRFMDEFGHMDYHGEGAVIGEFVCDRIITVDCDSVAPFCRETEEYIEHKTCLSRDELWKYTNGKCAFGWHISDLKIYDTPKDLSEFKSRQLVWRGNNHIHVYEKAERPPQSWCYVEEEDDATD